MDRYEKNKGIARNNLCHGVRKRSSSCWSRCLR